MIRHITPIAITPIALTFAIPLTALLATGTAIAAPRILPDHDVMGTYRITQPNRPDQTWRIRYEAASRRIRAVSLSGQARGVEALLNLQSGAADIIVPQMHAVVAVPGLSALIHKLTDQQNARFTPLGESTIAGHHCTRYLILKPNGSGAACITRGGVVLRASGKDNHGAMTITALSIHNAPQPPEAFTLPQGYSSISLPPQMLAQLLGQ